MKELAYCSWTHEGLDNIADTLQQVYLDRFVVYFDAGIREICWVLFSPIASKSALVQVLTYHRMGDKLLFEPTVIHVDCL